MRVQRAPARAAAAASAPAAVAAAATALLLVLVCVSPGAPMADAVRASSMTPQEKAERRLGKLRDAVLAATTSGGAPVVELVDKNYTRYTRKGPRSFGTVVLFTARAEQYKCSFCHPAEDEFRVLASSYYRHPDPAAPELFFAVSDFDGSLNTFKDMGFQSVPVVVYWPATEVNAVVDTKHAPLLRQEQKVFTAEMMADFLSERASIQARVTRSPEGQYWLSLVVVAVVGVMSLRGATDLRALVLPLHKGFWTFASLAVYAVGVSGLVYCVIRKPEFYTVSSTAEKEVSIFNPGSEQYVLEGATIGLLNLLAATGIIVLVRCSRRAPGASSGTNALESPVGVGSAFRYAVAAAVGMGLFAVAYARIYNAYTAKTPWYSLEAIFPKDVWDVAVDWVSSAQRRIAAQLASRW